jgi:hypothetical protein
VVRGSEPHAFAELIRALGGVFADSTEVLIADIDAALALPAAPATMRAEVIETADQAAFRVLARDPSGAATSAPILARSGFTRYATWDKYAIPLIRAGAAAAGKAGTHPRRRQPCLLPGSRESRIRLLRRTAGVASRLPRRRAPAHSSGRPAVVAAADRLAAPTRP